MLCMNGFHFYHFPINRVKSISLVPTVKTISKFTSIYRFIVANFPINRIFILSFYRFIVLLFFGKNNRLLFVLSFYRCKENIEFFYCFIVSSFYRCRPIVLQTPLDFFIVVDTFRLFLHTS